MEHEDNEHGWLAEDSKGEVGYMPVSCMMMIVDETVKEMDMTGPGKKDGWNQGWRGDETGWWKKKDVFSSSDKWNQE